MNVDYQIYSTGLSNPSLKPNGLAVSGIHGFALELENDEPHILLIAEADPPRVVSLPILFYCVGEYFNCF
jgi:hypothetical protein